jgi:pyrroloquinoline quinone (PQQ) biosynthesis protein C
MTMTAISSGIDTMWEKLVQMVNEQFDSLPFRRLVEMKLTRERAKHYTVQLAHYVKNRRDCWGYVQGAAPLEIKKIIWEHEQEELVGDQQAGKPDHIELTVKEGELFGLSAEDFDRIPPLEGAVVCFDAWTRLATRGSWLEAIAASAILEMRNSDELIRGGALSRRIGHNLTRDLGIPLKKQINNAEHVEADVRHAHLLFEVAEKHATSAAAQGLILRGAGASLLVDRVYRGHVADMLAALP